MYTRSIRNIGRLERERQALQEREEAMAKWEGVAGKLRRQSKRAKRRLVLFSLLALVLGGGIAYFILSQSTALETAAEFEQ